MIKQPTVSGKRASRSQRGRVEATSFENGLSHLKSDEGGSDKLAALFVRERLAGYGSKPIQSYRDLVVWQDGIALTARIYQLTSAFPKAEIYGMTSQLRRAAVSVPSNISEGWGRNSQGQFRAAVAFSRGSLAEVETLLEITKILNYAEKPLVEKLVAEADTLARRLYRLYEALKTAPRKLNNDQE